MGQRVRNYPTSPYPRPSARVITEASRVRVSGCGLGLAARLCRPLVRTPLAGTSAYTLTKLNRGARVVVFLRSGHPKLVTWVVRLGVLDVAMWRSASDVCRYLAARMNVLRVCRWHEGVGTDEKPAWARGYASSGCVSQKLRPTACGR